MKLELPPTAYGELVIEIARAYVGSRLITPRDYAELVNDWFADEYSYEP